jgi:hypothetical protein
VPATLFIRLPKEWGEEQLVELLESLGITANKTLKPPSRHFALVELAGDESVAPLMAINGYGFKNYRGELYAKPSLHPIVEKAEGSFDENNPVDNWLRQKSQGRQTGGRPSRKPSVKKPDFQPRDYTWPPRGVRQF